MRMIKSKGWITNVEIETIRRKIKNKGSDEVNDGTMQEIDNKADIYDENDNMNHADSASEEPIDITEDDLNDSKRDRLLISREALENNNFGKTEVKLKYGSKERLKKEVFKLNKGLEDIKISFTHCRNVIQGAMRVVEEVEFEEKKLKSSMVLGLLNQLQIF